MDRENAPLTLRQQRAAETILEDERLTSDLTDVQARPLTEWASQQAAAAAANPWRSDDEVDTAISSIRRAVRWVAAVAADEFDPERLVTLAEEALKKET
jgi:broad specificity phosphatase PhoE